jgi:hypothetical protein
MSLKWALKFGEISFPEDWIRINLTLLNKYSLSIYELKSHSAVWENERLLKLKY